MQAKHQFLISFSFNLLSFLRDESLMDEWLYASFSDDEAICHFAQFFILSQGETDVSGNDSLLAGFLGHIASELEDLTSDVFQDGSHDDS